MNVLLPLPIVAPLLGAAVALLLSRRPAAQRSTSVIAMTAGLVASVALLVEVERDGITSGQLGGWPAPIGITLVADLFSAMLLVVSYAVFLGVLVFAIGSARTADTALFFHPIYLILAAGVSASFLTGDLFNLFVAFEVMLSASYVLITIGGDRSQVRTGMTYVVINLLASTLLLVGVAFVYAATGTVNLADLAQKLPELEPGVRTALGLLLLATFGIKAAIFPLFFWLPDSYPTAPTPVTAIFAGLLTKVGVYAIIRTQVLLFPRDRASALLLVLAGLTMVVGVLGAIAQDDIKRILSFHIISQIGYMLMGVGLFSIAGLAGAVFFLIHQIPVKTALFLAGGMVEEGTGTAALHSLGGMLRRAPAVAALFFLSALSLAGIPPFSGFAAKLALVQAGVSQEQYAIVAVSLFVSILTLFSMTKIWSNAFWGFPEEPPPIPADPDSPLPVRRAMLWPATFVVALTVAIAVAGGPIYDLSERAATTLLEGSEYVQAVLEP